MEARFSRDENAWFASRENPLAVLNASRVFIPRSIAPSLLFVRASDAFHDFFRAPSDWQRSCAPPDAICARDISTRYLGAQAEQSEYQRYCRLIALCTRNGVCERTITARMPLLFVKYTRRCWAQFTWDKAQVSLRIHSRLSHRHVRYQFPRWHRAYRVTGARFRLSVTVKSSLANPCTRLHARRN